MRIQYSDLPLHLRQQVRREMEAKTPPPTGLPKASTSKMNKTEAAYERWLSDEKAAGRVLWFGFEAIKLRLADRTHYTPDFAVMTAAGLEIHEVKGFWRDDARVKIKVANEMFPFAFQAVKLIRGNWEREVFPKR